jgi:hypothetical protein
MTCTWHSTFRLIAIYLLAGPTRRKGRQDATCMTLRLESHQTPGK